VISWFSKFGFSASHLYRYAPDELNRIRKSLRALAKNSTAFGLKQPHLQRTKLCELTDADLEPAYVKQREVGRCAS
jgi:hypothetical protein